MLVAQAGEHVLSGDRRIVLDGAAAPQLLGAAQRLQAALRAAAAGGWPLSAFGAAAGAGVAVRIDPAKVAQPQGYELTITPDLAEILAHDPAGAFYAIGTLIQVVEQSGARLPCLRIVDWPDFPARGVMIDVSRDKVPTLDTLLELVDMLAGWKINQIQLYTEHTFTYLQHPEVWATASPITGEDILRLDAYCRERFVELVPNQNTFGHMNRWLKLARYNHLAEAPEGCDTRWGFMPPFTLCPGDPGSIALVRDMLDELLPHFSSPIANIGCDETVDLGQGRSKQACAERGVGRVYLEFLLQIYREVSARGRTMQFWGDIIMEHPELVPELPRDVIALEWGYEADHPFADHSARFAASGIPFYVCPGTSAWNTIAGRSDNALANLRSAAEHGLRNGAIGYLNTDWGDNGHWQALPVSYLGMAAGAAYSWCYAANRDLDLLASLDRFAFRDRAGAAGRLAYDLGNIYRAVGFEPHNSSALFWTFQRPIADLAANPIVPAAGYERALEAIDEVTAGLPPAQFGRPDADLLAREFAQTVRLLRHASRRGLYAHSPTPELARELEADLRETIGEYRAIWLARNRPGGLDDSVARLERALADYAAA
jgi:hypothetical protein